jgi:hypothetical protein
MPRNAITRVSPVPYVFVTLRQLTAKFSSGPVVPIAYSIVRPRPFLERRVYLTMRDCERNPHRFSENSI